MATHRYFAAPDAGFDDDDAAILGERITTLSREGTLTPEAVVEDARPPQSPTHRFFEWDDRVAAERYRVSQATHYLSNIYVMPAEARDPIRADQLIRLQARGPREAARPVTHIETAADVVAQARRDLEHWRQRYETRRELRPATLLVREALETLEALARQALARAS